MAAMKWSDSQLQDACDPLMYELEMLLEMRDAAPRPHGKNVWSERARENALLESFLVHARILIEFLYLPNRKPEDVAAVDFFDNPETWKGTCGEESELLKTTRDEANKRLAHLTIRRVTPNILWNYKDICGDICTAFDTFLRIVPHARIAPDLLGLKARSAGIGIKACYPW